jgi:hypothetical protein
MIPAEAESTAQAEQIIPEMMNMMQQMCRLVCSNALELYFLQL